MTQNIGANEQLPLNATNAFDLFVGQEPGLFSLCSDRVCRLITTK
jgi:hypothetical protein